MPKEKLAILFMLAAALLGANCTSRSGHRNYYTVQEKAEGDFNVLKISLNYDSFQVKDTMYLLSRDLDIIEEKELWDGFDLSKLFTRYSGHPLSLKEYHYDKDSLYFRSDWFLIYNNRLMFEFHGKPDADLVHGLLVSSWFIVDLDETFVDTSLVSFTSSRYRPRRQASQLAYRVGVVKEDSVSIERGTWLFRGDTVKVILDKSTGEGTYVKTQNDSGTVYYRAIEILCWVKEDSKGIDLITEQMVKLERNQPFILDSLIKSEAFISDNTRKIKTSREIIVFDNREYFDKHTR